MRTFCFQPVWNSTSLLFSISKDKEFGGQAFGLNTEDESEFDFTEIENLGKYY